MNDTRKKPVGLTEKAGWQIGLRRTIAVPHKFLWDVLVSSNGLNIWLGDHATLKLVKGAKYQLKDGTYGEVKVFHPESHLRITRKPLDSDYDRPSTIQVRVVDKGEKSVLVFHEENLPNQKERYARKEYYSGVVEQIKSLVS